MSPETRAFLDAVRTAEDPLPEDQRRVLAAVRAAVVTGAVAGAGVGASKAAKLLGGGVASCVKIGGVVLGLSAAVWIAGATLSVDRAPPPVAVVPPRPVSTNVAEQRAPAAPHRPPLAAPAATQAPAIATASPSVPSPAVPSASAVPATPSLREELALLAEVQAALTRGDGSSALRRLDEHTTTDRRLLAERRAARIRALCLLGRTAEAAGLARAFLRDHPTSVQRGAVERSCASEATELR